jgi:acyl-coenzyme A synthetase/AMP-(fatty) acid ligase
MDYALSGQQQAFRETAQRFARERLSPHYQRRARQDRGWRTGAAACLDRTDQKPVKADARYIESYWSTLPGLWVHGDFAMRGEDGLFYILGRSDDTIKISGKRTGPSELEGILVATGKLAEAAVIGIPHPVKGSAIICACVPMPGVEGRSQPRGRAIVGHRRGYGHVVSPRNDPVC